MYLCSWPVVIIVLCCYIISVYVCTIVQLITAGFHHLPLFFFCRSSNEEEKLFLLWEKAINILLTQARSSYATVELLSHTSRHWPLFSVDGVRTRRLKVSLESLVLERNHGTHTSKQVAMVVT